MQSALLNSTTPASQPNAYTDFGDLAVLRREARQTPDAALAKVAKQFESLFIKMMLGSMRQASQGDPLFDSHQSELYRDMFDNQIALDMAEGKGIGLAASLLRQLQRQIPHHGSQPASSPSVVPLPEAQATAAAGGRRGARPQADVMPAIAPGSSGKTQPAIPPLEPSPASASGKKLQPGFDGPESFVRRLWPEARRAAAELGVAPEVLLAQAALETGWGRAVLRHADGRSSHNLFNIKADARWAGARVNTMTLEYRDGLAQQEAASFRAYDSYAASFRDYVDFLQTQPRYATALQQTQDAGRFVQALQDAGYATDPDYASKIMNIMQRKHLSALGEGGPVPPTEAEV